MKNKLISALVATFMIGGLIAVHSVSLAQHRTRHTSAYQHRQDTKNEWRNLAITGGVLGLLGAMNRDSTLTFLGTAGALYSVNRYEQDRKSQNRMSRARAYYFSKPYFTRDGHRYRRMTTYRHGAKYYYFKRVY